MKLYKIASRNLKILTLTLCFAAPLSAWSQVVSKVSNKTVLIDMKDGNLAEGSEWITVNDLGKKTGLIRIKKVKGSKALADITKGVVAVGQTLIPKPGPKSRFKEDGSADNGQSGAGSDTSTVTKSNLKRVGGVFSYAMDSMSLTAGNATNTLTVSESLSGTGMQLAGFYDWAFTPALAIRFYGSYDTFAASVSTTTGAVNNNGSTTSSLSISALGLGGDAQWRFIHDKTKNIWAGVGFTYDYLLSNSSNIISLTTPSYVNYVSPGLGIDYAITPKYFIPAAFHYDYYIAGSGVSQSALRFSAGFGMFL